MPLPRSRHLLLAALMSTGLAACGESGTTNPPPGGGAPLVPATWHMHTADGEALPAVISERIVGVAQERTMLDSSILVINDDFTYEQRYWIRVLVTGNLDRSEMVFDEGTYAPEGLGYRVISDLRAREFSFVVPTIGDITTTEQMLFFANAPPLTTGTYRLSRP